MARRFLLPLLAFALFTTEAATAQTAPTAAATATTTAAQPYKTPAQLARAQRRAGRTLTARERRQADAAAKAAAKAAQADAALAMNTSKGGWSDEPISATSADPATGRPTLNLSVAPGMPINQIGHGVTTDYNGRPIQRTPASTTMAAQR